MLFWIVAATVPIYAGALYMSYGFTARQLEAGAQRDVDELVTRLAAEIDATVRPIEGGVRTLALQLEAVNPPASQYPQRILGILNAWPDVYGSTIAVAPGTSAGAAEAFAPYYFRRDGAYAFSDLAHEAYAYTELPWYRRAAEGGHPVWSLPYFDAGGGNAWMVTYSVPFFHARPDARRVLAGVVTADLDLQWVNSAAARATLGPIGLGWLSSPPSSHSFVAPIGDTGNRVGTLPAPLDRETIRRHGEAMLARKSGFELLPLDVTPAPAYLAVRNLETFGWRVMLVIPQAELLGDARQLLNRQLWLGAGGLVLLIAAITAVAAGITRPLRALAAAVSGAGGDDAEFVLPQGGRHDEIGVLTEALRRMRDSLQQHLQLRARTLAEEARRDHDLHIASSIQQSMLPRITGPVELPGAIQVAAALKPASQVGGDLYDFFAAPGDTVFFAVGDVSDKGVPAALFMARLSALLRVKASGGMPVDQLLRRLNRRLSEGNDACMFVTMGCGLLNVDTGCVRYGSAGHEPPVLRHVEGTVTPLVVENGPAMGIEDDTVYPLAVTFMAPGDTLVLCTDGVTEAQAEDGSLFGFDRLQELLRTAPGTDPAAMVELIVGTVAAHAPRFRATDDLTVLAVRWNPPRVSARAEGGVVNWSMQLDTSGSGVQEAQHWLHAILTSRGVAPERVGDAELIAEELLTNIVRAFAASSRGTRIALDCALSTANILLTVRDDGAEFDPLSRPGPDLDADISVRDPGGLGILLVRQLAEACRYDRLDGWNVMEVRLGRQPHSH